MDDMLLEKIDLLRERMNVSYKEARQALEEAEGSVVEALVLLENQVHTEQRARATQQSQYRSEYAVRSSELIERVKELLHRGNITKLRVLHDNEVLLELPLTFGAASVLILPQLALLAGIAVLFARVTIQIEQPFQPCSCNCGCDAHSGTDCDCNDPKQPPLQPETVPSPEPDDVEAFTWVQPGTENDEAEPR